MSLPDSPVRIQSNDRLNRAPMAKHVAKLVNDFDSKESFVVGIEGEWGSGKSSFINFVCEEIDPAKAHVVFFNPWNFSSQDQLIEDFFNSLLEAIEKLDPNNKVVDEIKKYKRKLKNVEINPSIAGFSIGSWKVEKASLGSLRESLEKELARFDKKILIIIDDIDRLDTKETLAVFKLVKVTANFSNCIFFLAYDRKRVIQRIDEVTNKSGDDYLKKIIQTTFRLPTINRAQIKDMVLEQINNVLKELFGGIELNAEDTKRWDSIIYDGFTDLFQNIRDLKRYASSLKLNLSVIGKHEVNIVDFVVLEAIRVFATDFYEEIPKNRWLFTQKFYGMSYSSREDKRPEAFTRIVENTLSTNPAKEQILKIMKEIFPQIDFHSNYSNDWEERWSGNKQACSDSKFETYFHLTAPADEISEEEFEEMIEQIGAKNVTEVLPVFEKLKSENKLRNFLKKTHDRFGQDFDTHSKFFTNVTTGLLILSSKVNTDTNDFWDFGGVERQLQRLVWRLSEKISGEENKYDFLKNLLILTPDLSYKVSLLRVLAREKTGEQDHLRDMSTAIKRSIADILPELQKVIDDDTLKMNPRANHIIWCYVEWGKEAELKIYLKKLVEDKQDIFTVLDWFKSRVDSSTRGQYYQLNKESLGKFVDLSIFEATLSQIDSSKITPKQKELYDLYYSKEDDF